MEQRKISEILTGEEFNFISQPNKDFVIAFDDEMSKIGYGFGTGIEPGKAYFAGKYTISYSKIGAKTKKIIAKFHIKEDRIELRLYVYNDIEKHRNYIENSTDHIKDIFLDEGGVCKGTGFCGCKQEKEKCKFRRVYTINDKYIEKCVGVAFEITNPSIGKIPDYISLLAEFYPVKKSNHSE